MERKLAGIFPRTRRGSTDALASSTNNTASNPGNGTARNVVSPTENNLNANATNLNTSINKVFGKLLGSPSTLEKVTAKRLKVFMDSKASIKTRFANLQEILVYTESIDLPNFYKEHAEIIFEVVGEKGSVNMGSKDIVNLSKTFPILRQIFLILSDKIRENWQDKALFLLLCQLLHYGNHPALRVQGFELLLIWLSVLRAPAEGPVWLYQNAISLDVYAFDRLDIASYSGEISRLGFTQLGQELIIVDERTPLVASPFPSTYHDSNHLFQVLLKNIVQLAYVASGSTQLSDVFISSSELDSTSFPPEDFYSEMSMDAAHASIKFMYGLFQDHYLAKLFPANFKLHFPSDNQFPIPGFQTCPPSVLHIWIQFLVQNCLDDSSKLQGIRPLNASQVPSSPACPFLKKIILGTPLNRGYVNEALRQATLVSPYGFSSGCMETMRGAILIIGTWLISEEKERPVFLRKTTAEADARLEDTINYYLGLLQASIVWEVQFSILDHPVLPSEPTQLEPHLDRSGSSKGSQPPTRVGQVDYEEFTQAQSMSYIEIMLIFKAIVTNSQNLFSTNNKEFVCKALLEMNERFLFKISSSPTFKFTFASGRLEIKSRFLNAALSMFYETLFYAWSASKIGDKELWLLFQTSLIRSTLLSIVIKNWSIFLVQFTLLFASKRFGLEYDPRNPDLTILLNYDSKKAPKCMPFKDSTPKELKRLNTVATPEFNFSSNLRSPTESKPAGFNLFTAARRNYSVHRKNQSKSSSIYSLNDQFMKSEFNVSVASQGFHLLSEYYHLVYAPNLPQSSNSSTHSVNSTTPPDESDTTRSGSPSLRSQHSAPANGNGADQTSQNHENNPWITAMSQLGLLGHSFSRSNATEMDFSFAGWSLQEVSFVWKNLLCCLGNVNSIKYHKHHEAALSTVIKIYDGLQIVRTFKSPTGPPIPCSYEMATWIIKAGDLISTFDDGRLLAFEWICRVLSSRFGHEQIVHAYNTTFYRHILRGLTQKDPRLLRIILEHGTYIFSRSHPEINMLAPALLTALKSLLLDSPTNDEPRLKLTEGLRRKSVSMLLSLLHLPYLFPNLDLPVLTYRELLLGDTIRTIPVDELKPQIQRILLTLCEEDEWSALVENFPETHAMIIGGLSIQVTYELFNAHPNLTVILQNLSSILDYLYSSNIVLVNVAVDCISYFASSCTYMVTLEDKLLISILDDVVGALSEHLNLHNSTSLPHDRYILTRLYFCLLEWLIHIPYSLLRSSALESKVFEVINRGIQESPQFDAQSLNLDRTLSGVKDAAHMVLYYLMDHFSKDRFDSDLTSNLDETSASDPPPNCQYVAFNRACILAFYRDLQSENGEYLVVTRNLFGKYIRVFQTLADLPPQSPTSPTEVISFKSESNHELIEESDSVEETSPLAEVPEPKLQSSSGDHLPDLDGRPSADDLNTGTKGIDTLDQAMNFIEKRFEEDGHTSWVSNPSNLMQADNSQDYGVFNFNPSARPATEPSPTLDENEQLSQKPEWDLQFHSKSDFLFLNGLHTANFDNLDAGKFVYLNPSESFLRDLRALDKKLSRETVKLALIYVEQGQTTSEQILANNSPSQQYIQFSRSLGWEIDLATHGGYLGGLERSGTNGTTALYYSNPTTEIIYHDITLMPTDPNDLRQVKKKRHVGNDPVHIIWNESKTAYSTHTIGGDFGNVQILIHPLPNNTFDVRVYKDGQVGCFGPLVNGTVISKQLLPNLVRATAINAYRSILSKSLGYLHNAFSPSVQRNQEIQSIVAKYGSLKKPT